VRKSKVKGSVAAELYNVRNGLATRTADELRKKWVVLVRTVILNEIITEIIEKNEKENITNIDLSEYYNEKGDMKRKSGFFYLSSISSSFFSLYRLKKLRVRLYNFSMFEPFDGN